MHMYAHIYMYIGMDVWVGALHPLKEKFKDRCWTSAEVRGASFLSFLFHFLCMYIYIYDSSGAVQRSLLDFSRGLYYVCVLTLLNMCPHTTKCVLILLCASSC
jgi:hypothetical protein